MEKGNLITKEEYLTASDCLDLRDAVTMNMAQAWRSQRNMPKPPPKQSIDYLTYRAGDLSDPRASACVFATSCRDDLITIIESWPSGYLHVTVYFWKEE